MIRKDRQREQQNRGFTLLEVLIAITILVIIAVLILSAFVTGAGMNAKARRMKNATNVAENVMEELKSSTFDELTVLFASAEADGPGTTVEAAWGGIVDSQTMTTDEDNTTYSFYTTDVPMNNTTYDVAVHLTPDSNGTKVLSKAHSMNEAGCGYYVEDEDMNLRAAQEFQRRNTAYAYKATIKANTDAFMKMMKRAIEITVDENTVDVTYTYTIPSEVYTEAGDNTYAETVRIFENTVSKETLKAVYLYYYPLFSNEVNADAIKINNEDGIASELEVFIIKMDAENPIEKGAAESVPAINILKGGGTIQICTNLTSPIVIGDPAAVTNLSNTEETVSLYDVKVEVFTHNDTKAFAAKNLIETYTGSFMDKTE